MSEVINDEHGKETRGHYLSEPPADFGHSEFFKCPECERLKRQNAELLEALRECERFCEFEGSPLGLSVAKIARSAIRRAEEGK
jgi:hypothetical protein